MTGFRSIGTTASGAGGDTSVLCIGTGNVISRDQRLAVLRGMAAGDGADDGGNCEAVEG